MEERVEAISDIQDGFIFRGGILALDLVNTEIMERGKYFDLLDNLEALERWWKAALTRYPQIKGSLAYDNFTPELLGAVKTLRATLRQAFAAVVNQESPTPVEVEVINRALAMADLTLERAGNGSLVQAYTIKSGGSDILFYVAFTTLQLLTQKSKERLHKCDNERCILYFYDFTKSATRRWCSTDCQNRVRSSRNYRLNKEARHNHIHK